MWILDKDTKSLKAKTAVAPGTPLTFDITFIAKTLNPKTDGATHSDSGTINDTYSNIVTPPYGIGIKKDIQLIHIHNADGVSHTVTVSLFDNGVEIVLFNCLLGSDWNLEWNCVNGKWILYDELGNCFNTIVNAGIITVNGDPNPNAVVRQVLIDLTVTENITAGDVVNGDGSKANSAIYIKRNKVIGIAKATIANGFSGQIVTEGEVENLSWSWIAGNSLYLNGTSLSTTPAATGFVKKIGVAKTPTKVEVILEPSILI